MIGGVFFTPTKSFWREGLYKSKYCFIEMSNFVTFPERVFFYRKDQVRVSKQNKKEL